MTHFNILHLEVIAPARCVRLISRGAFNRRLLIVSLLDAGHHVSFAHALQEFVHYLQRAIDDPRRHRNRSPGLDSNGLRRFQLTLIRLETMSNCEPKVSLFLWGVL